MKEIVFSAAVMAAGVIVYLLTLMFPSEFAQQGGVGPGFFPRVMAILLFVLGGILLHRSLRLRSQQRKQQSSMDRQPLPGSRANQPVVMAFVIILCYAVGIYFVGFLIGTMLFLLGMISFYTSGFKWRRLLQFILPVSAGITVVIYLVFRVAIRIPFPRGMLF